MKKLKNLVCAGVLATLGFNAVADTIYNSGPNYNTNLLQVQNGLEVGNEISLTPGLWNLTNFAFEYYSPQASLNTSLGVDVRFYLNNGAPSGGYPTPGTLIYDSGWFLNTLGGITAGGVAHDISYTPLDLYSGSGPLNLTTGYLLPAELTFTITFTNVGSDLLYLPLADNQAGISFGSYWRNNAGSWSLLTNSAPANFVVNVEGVPEPTVFGLGALGGALLLGVSKLRRKR